MHDESDAPLALCTQGTFWQPDSGKLPFGAANVHFSVVLKFQHTSPEQHAVSFRISRALLSCKTPAIDGLSRACDGTAGAGRSALSGLYLHLLYELLAPGEAVRQ